MGLKEILRNIRDRDEKGKDTIIVPSIIPIINKGTMENIQQQDKPLSPITLVQTASDKLPLKETEDKISKWFQDQKEADREAIKALVYRILYNEGLRINRAEQIITRSFKV